ncbi:ANK_REP_REGION domain-containing protein [Caenorhabditis elegans]|uniref:ANK_REP_REGION domain-containing protein n=1 Tax=Caenorhabditis elegans TaxID=6239 RepID=Q86MI9_CAEEL|nr:ANK_REP_REGION domain-containing protein [Caenorhabditis elegans]CCD64551.1 ANK_REP_REGION domain-containing protein [Caenorhabditis elegans]|eukprot:NP_001024943.1 Uncharacterized protein CELE_W05H9.4 [Caenorhabditis elegans]
MNRGPRNRPHQKPDAKSIAPNYFLRASMRVWARERENDDRIHEYNIDTETMTAETLKKFTLHCQRVALKSKIASDDFRFITEYYDEKVLELKKSLLNILRGLWKEVPPPHLRLEFANLISFIVTFAEMVGYVHDTMSIEKTHLPCDLVNKFSNYLYTIEQCKRYGHADLTHFAQLLDFRDEVLMAIQVYYRIRCPMRENKEPSFPKDAQRYSPYDYEWLCGSVISGPYFLECTKYLCTSRIAQMDITTLRHDIIAATKGKEYKYYTHIRVPFPKTAKNSKALADALANREGSLKAINAKTRKELRKDFPRGHRLFHFTTVADQFFILRSDIRAKKRTVADSLIRSDISNVTPFHLIIAVLSAVEAQLLMVHKVYALFVDEKLGLYGKPLPQKVLEIAFNIYLMTGVDSCKTMPLNENIEECLQSLRKATRDWIRQYYRGYEDKCESNYTKNVYVNIESGYNFFPYELKVEDFPEEIAHHAKLMMEHLYFEEFELNRLSTQLSQVRTGYSSWPSKEGTPSLSLNNCKDHVYAFHSNFCTVRADILEKVNGDTTSFEDRMEFANYPGYEIVCISHKVIDEKKCVPSIAEINHEFAVAFKEAFGTRIIDDFSFNEMAYQFAEIVNAEIDFNNLRKKYKYQKGSTATAKKMISEIMEFYMDYIKKRTNHFDLPEPPLARRQDPNCNPYSDEEYDTELEDEDDEVDGDQNTGENLLSKMFGEVSLGAVSIGSENDTEVEDPTTLVIEDRDQVPDDMVDEFIHGVFHVNLGMIPDLSASLYNLPLD